jgi:hypothetical protein
MLFFPFLSIPECCAAFYIVLKQLSLARIQMATSLAAFSGFIIRTQAAETYTIMYLRENLLLAYTGMCYTGTQGLA